MNKLFVGLLLIFAFILTACKPVTAVGNQSVQPTIDGSAIPSATQQMETQSSLIKPDISPTETVTIPLVLIDETRIPTENVTELPTAIATNTVRPTLAPEAWKELPIIPVIGPNVVKIYQRGIELGNNPQSFSKIGDCGSTPAWFLGDFDRGPRFYSLGEYQNLNAVIEAFHGSYSRTSLAAKSGFNASSIFSALWADPKQCQSGESPLACEYRVNRPVIAFIMLGSNDVFHPKEFEPQMRKIIEDSILQGVIPVLSTKADNTEGDGSINSTIARLAQEYDIPLWNYWRAVQDLPDKGLQSDQVHLTWGPNRFDDALTMTRAWPVRNLTALQTLDAIWRAIAPQS